MKQPEETLFACLAAAALVVAAATVAPPLAAQATFRITASPGSRTR